MKAIQLLFILLISFCLGAQELSFEMENNYVYQFGANSDSVGFIPLFQLDSDSIHNKHVSANIKGLPNGLNRSKTAYGFVRFTGLKQSEFANQLTLLVEHYNTENPTIYVDRNGNLDFSDDGMPLRLETELTLKLVNSEDPSGIFNLRLAKSKITTQNSERIKGRYSGIYPKGTIIAPSNWLTSQRFSVRLSKGKINGKPITILLYDGTSDGLFTFDTGIYGDRIFITDEYIDENMDLHSFIRLGEPIDHNAVFSLYGQKYRVTKVLENGDGLSIIESNNNTKVIYNIGTDISSLEIKLLTGPLLPIKELLKNDKHLLIDIGGTWCGGCIAQEPIIKKLHLSGKVNVLGIFGYDNERSVKNYIKEHKLEWPVALLSDTFQELFRISRYPTYILISPQGKVILIDFNAYKIADYFTL